MGTLIAKAYPTKLFLKAADHTYVECGTGAKGWACWGGKAHGVQICSGAGSTQRADLVAEPNERAQVAVYLVNGVCHQAANRILTQTKVQVSTARGYWVSQSIFGTYGKPSLYNRYLTTSGDVAVCVTAAAQSTSASAPLAMQMTKKELVNERSLRREHERLAKLAQDPSASSTVFDFMKANVQAFERGIISRLKGVALSPTALRGLRQAKEEVEIEHYRLNQLFLRRDLAADKFVLAFNAMTYKFQDQSADALNAEAYQIAFQLAPDERLVLADPDAIDVAYGDGTAAAIYGDLLKV